MAHQKERAEWRCVLEAVMAQCVMTSGTVWMPKLSVDNWDSMTLVREYLFRRCGFIMLCIHVMFDFQLLS